MDLEKLYEKHLEDSGHKLKEKPGRKSAKVGVHLGARRMAKFRALMEFLDKSQSSVLRQLIDEGFERQLGGGEERPAVNETSEDTSDSILDTVERDWPTGDLQRLDRLLSRGGAIGRILERLARDYDLSKTEMLIRVIEVGIKCYMGGTKDGQRHGRGG